MKENKYKIKSTYVIRNKIGENILIPTDEEAQNKDSVILNETALFICSFIKDKYATKSEIIDEVIKNYNIDYKTAKKDVSEILDYFLTLSVLEENTNN